MLQKQPDKNDKRIPESQKLMVFLDDYAYKDQFLRNKIIQELKELGVTQYKVLEILGVIVIEDFESPIDKEQIQMIEGVDGVGDNHDVEAC